MPTVMVHGEPVGEGIHEAGGGIEEDLPVEAEGESPLPILCDIASGGVIVGPSLDPERMGEIN